MTETTIDVPRSEAPELAEAPLRSLSGHRGWSTSALAVAQRYRWWLGAAALVLTSAAVLLAARTRPGYDPYGWLVWGHLSLHGALDTNGAPSWKPLPFLFTVPYNLAGHAALWLWMLTAVAVSLSGAVFAWRVAFRLTGATPARRYASYLAGAVAAAAVLGIDQYSHYVLSSQSDTMIVATCIAAIDCQLARRYRWALALWWLGALGRPEVWPFLGAYAVWAWWKLPHLRKAVAAALVLVGALWFGIPALTAKSFFIAGDNALHSPRELHGNKVAGTLQRLFALQPTLIWVAALVAVAIGALRRRIAVVLMGAGVAVWGVTEIAFALHGWPAVPRYMFEAAGVAGVLAGTAVGMVVVEVPPLLRRLAPRAVSAPVAGGAAAVAVIAFLAALAPWAHQQYRIEKLDLKHERTRTEQIARLATALRLVGAKRMFACGKPEVPIGYQSILAWDLGVKTGILYFGSASYPHVAIDATRHGWHIFASSYDPATRPTCNGINVLVGQ